MFMCTLHVQGNCSSPDPAAALGVAAADPDTTSLLPLKPYQCLVLVDDSWLRIYSGRAWLDNIYLKLSRHGGPSSLSLIWLSNLDSRSGGPYLYATNMTFHSERHRNAAAVWNMLQTAAVYFDGAALKLPTAIPRRCRPLGDARCDESVPR